MPIKVVLLVEHEASLRAILYACLTEFSPWKVISSNSIQAGIDLCAVDAPDAILLDASTAEADALIFVEQLKQYSKSQAIPILLLTDRASWFTKEQLNEMGFAGAIEKPFDPSTIPDQVSQLLRWKDI
ncbi:MAG: response regulator [Leptolyngbyaceae cyanobacterium bins.349]|nr:response regulator [Leptolyngbyaceae cyanobacterium bins.349]